MNRSSSSKKRVGYGDQGFAFEDTLFSWSLEDICNESLYKPKVDKIQLSFDCVEQYLRSFVYPLLEESRAKLYSSMELLSSSPFAQVISLEEADKKRHFNVKIDTWKNRFSGLGNDPYKALFGDLFILADFKPETVNDLLRVGLRRMWTFGILEEIIEDGGDVKPMSTFQVFSSKDIDVTEVGQKSLYIIFLTNIIPEKRIWNALHMQPHSKLMERVLCSGSVVVKESCDYCSPETDDALRDDKIYQKFTSKLNKSQFQAISSCLSSVHCNHKSTVDLICGPPGTGKTKTLGTLLFALLKMNRRTLVCAPTNVAIKEVASRVLSMVRASFDKNSGDLFRSLGDMLLFGNHEQLKVGAEIKDIYLDYRVEQLTMCFTPPTGWRYCFSSMLDLLENCVSHYHKIENELRKEQDQIDENNPSDCGVTGVRMCKSFLEFVRERFRPIELQIRNCVSILCTHVARSSIMEHNLKDLACLIDSLDSFQALLFETNVDCEVLEELFSPRERQRDSYESVLGAEYSLYKKGRTECMALIRRLEVSLAALNMPNVLTEDDGSIREFCLQRSSLIFSTASSSFKLHSVSMEPLHILVVDEAAQLKECESTIPLLLPEIKHAILVGDECQLPAMVVSPVSSGVGFGRSLFQRLRLLRHPNCFLKIQYRMHPAISSFPNSRFYFNQILDDPNFVRKNYINQILPRPMFGPYSFINIIGGSEEFDDASRSRKNIVEVAVVIRIIKNCFKAWLDSKENFSIGVVSPYAAQVVAIRDMVGHKYDRHKGFDVKVKTIDGFQGGEHDIIILSTVRTNCNTPLKFITDHQRTNVALTRARHCLWILGNERTLVSQENVWKALVLDAKKRKCFFNADEDQDLAKSILDAKTELDQFDDLLNADSVIFRNSRWKVLFSDNFLKSFKKLSSKRTKQSVISLLLKLSSGWRPKKIKVDLLCGNSSQMLKQYKVEDLFVVCSKDIVKDSMYTQVLKIWDVLQPEDIPKVVKRLDSIFGSFTDDFTSRCNEQCFEGKMEVPMSWENSTKFIKFKTLDNNGNEAESSCSDQRVYVENSEVEESLLLMKFYPLSSVVVSHLLSDCNNNELDLPFEVSDEERDIILFSGSSFILGRSGTGKTTILTMKLFHRENSHHTALEEMDKIKSADVPCLNCEECQESSTVNDRPVLRQLFVTESPKLCQAVKHHVGRMQRFICGGNNLNEISSLVEEDIADVDTSIQFKDVTDSFVNLPINSYPLVITFQKFLMMLDGTVGNSYFERFNDLSSQSQSLGVRSVALETFIRKKEVTYDRFDAIYWPHFSSQYTKMLDSSRVFIEIISHIKGGMQVVEPGEGKLSRERYLSLSENRSSSLGKEKRERIYDIFQSYEKMKIDKGDFDMADFVADLHHRLRNNKYEGDEMHFVYIDEVQDLTMSQIALFKYVCQNVDEGFVFCGDTAQTIARGIDFRFQDIRSLFYKKFVVESKRTTYNQGKEKVKNSDTFLLNQNFRTHAGVLKLSQSTIEILYRFFPLSVDLLKPETSVIYGEAPVVLECGSAQNAIETIFGNGGHVGGDIVGFGAEQVILVRDQCARKEILPYVGKQAIVLTILECKGLEFQDVLLYNFFGASPLENRWRVIYEYMSEQDMLDPTDSKSYPHFSDSKHNLLCSELKQLYVAITRTRQRLWICERTEDYCRPMFDYWKKKCLVQFKELDDSLALAMKVASTPEEWKSRGKKLYYQNNYETATACFERAGDSYWEKKSKAAHLRATADRLCGLNPKDADAFLREAAEIFEGIGMTDSAAQCFSDLGDYERAGKLYLEKCEEPDLKRAGDCFDLAGCYEDAAQVYARGNFFKDCLNVCAKGGLFDKGLHYIQHWKQNENAGCGWAKSNDLYAMEQDFLESCARKYFDRRDNRLMMNFVRNFHSMDLKRKFLQSLSLLDELIELEEESGNFMEAVNIAKMMGDTLKEADLLGKAGNFKEASELVLRYVLANSLWSSGSKGWPLKSFENKVELLGRAISFAKQISSSFCDLASAEAEILSNEHRTSLEIMSHYESSLKYRSTRGQILCLRKLLEAHCGMKSSKYVWQDSRFDSSCEEMTKKDQFSVETLFKCWTCWASHIFKILLDMWGCLPNFRTQELDNCHVKFALNYLGVQKQHLKLNEAYLLLVPDASWVMELRGKSIKKSGGLVYVDVHHLVSFAQRFWRSELLSVGMVVLQKLDDLFSVSKAHSEICQFEALLNLYEVSKFLKSECFHHSHSILKQLEKFYSRPIECFFRYVVPLDCKKSLSKKRFYLRVTKTCQDLMEEAVYDSIKRKDRLTLDQIGRVVVMILSTPSVNLNNELFVEIMTRFADHIPWRVFIQTLQQSSKDNQGPDLMLKFFEALRYTYNVNWRMVADYVSPCCFVYLIEYFLLLLPHFSTGCMFGTKSAFFEWFIGNTKIRFGERYNIDAEEAYEFIANILREFVLDQNGTKEWIRKSNLDVKNYFPVLLLRMVVLVCLLHLISGKYEELINDLLRKECITSQLPFEFRNVLHKGRKHMGLEVIAEAFKVIDNPLIIANLYGFEEIVCPDAVFVDLTSIAPEIILQTFFPNIVDDVGVETASATVETFDATSKEFPSDSDEENNDVNEDYNLWVLLENLQLATNESYFYRLPLSFLIKECFDPWIQDLTSPIQTPNELLSENETQELVGFHDKMKHLLEELNTRDSVHENRIAITLIKKILSRRPIVEPLLNKYIFALENLVNVEQEPSQASVTAGNDENGQNAEQAPILYKPLLIQGRSDANVDLEPSQASTAAGNDENRQKVVKKNKGKRKESKKNKGGNKGGK